FLEAFGAYEMFAETIRSAFALASWSACQVFGFGLAAAECDWQLGWDSHWMYLSSRTTGTYSSWLARRVCVKTRSGADVLFQHRPSTCCTLIFKLCHVGCESIGGYSCIDHR